MNTKKTACLIIAALALAGCGRKGPLYLEPVLMPAGVQDLTVRQIGSSVRLQWTMPNQLNDKKTEMDLKHLGQITVRMSEKTLPPNRFGSKAGVLTHFKANELQPTDKRKFSATCKLKDKTLNNRQLFFTVEYDWARRHSPGSAVATLKPLPPPVPISDLRVSREGKTIILHWSRAISEPRQEKQAVSVTPPPISAASEVDEEPPAGYDIYRRISGGDGEKEMRRLNDKPLSAEYYEDHDASRDGEYHYLVTVRLSAAVESAFSNEAAITFADTFAPDIPRGLVTFSGRDHILLSWEKVADLDLAGYRVFRKGPQDSDFRPLADVQTENVFRDMQVGKGKSYQYAVSAVDRKKNESVLSAAITHKFE